MESCKAWLWLLSLWTKFYVVTIQNKTSSAVFSHGAIYLPCCSNFWICGRNLMLWPFKWKLFSSTFAWCCSFFNISQSEILKFVEFWLCPFLGVKGLKLRYCKSGPAFHSVFSFLFRVSSHQRDTPCPSVLYPGRVQSLRSTSLLALLLCWWTLDLPIVIWKREEHADK